MPIHLTLNICYYQGVVKVGKARGGGSAGRQKIVCSIFSLDRSPFHIVVEKEMKKLHLLFTAKVNTDERVSQFDNAHARAFFFDLICNNSYYFRTEIT